MRVPVENVNPTDLRLFAKIGARHVEVMERNGIAYVDIDENSINGADEARLETHLAAALLSWKAAISQAKTEVNLDA